MAQQTLSTVVTIGGRVDNSFGRIGDALISMGSQVDVISQKIIGFGKDSVQSYMEYDDLMRQVQAVGEFSAAEIKVLEEINSEIAKTSVYSNKQAAEAEVIMGQYGMRIGDIKDMLPSVLDLAMAGNIEISDSIDYLYSSLMSLGEGVDYAGVLTDQMAKTAAIGATDVDTLGDSLMRLGSGAQMFKGGSAEILTILTAMSQFGQDQRGAQAGTWLRNFMLSLAAPAGNIEDIVDAMEQLGIAEDEIAEYADAHKTGASQAAVNGLVADGLRVYDDTGKLLPAMEVIKSLRNAVRGSGEYADDLGELTGALAQSGNDIEAFMTQTEGLTDNALYGVFRQIFGRRGIATALNLISITDAEWDQYWTDIANSAGFAESMGETMQGGLGGALRELNAAWEEFQTTFGKTISPVVEAVADFLHDVVVALDEMDEDSMNMLVSSLTAIAAMGPALMAVGGALKLIGFFLTPGGAIAGSIMTIAGLLDYTTKLSEVEMSKNFGTMQLDFETLGGYVAGLGEDFKASYTEINKFKTATSEAVTAYKEASAEFMGGLYTKMLTGATLTKEEQDAFTAKGAEIVGYAQTGMVSATKASISFWQMMWGGKENAEMDPEYLAIYSDIASDYGNAKETLKGYSQGLADAYNSAFADGKISPEEYENIQSYFEDHNRVVAEQAAQAKEDQDYADMELFLHRAQAASYDDIKQYAGELEGKRDELLAEQEEAFLVEYYKEESRLNRRIANGTRTEEDKQTTLEALKNKNEEKNQEIYSWYTDGLIRLWESGIETSQLGDAYDILGQYADRYMAQEITGDKAVSELKDMFGRSKYAGDLTFAWDNTIRQQLGEQMARIIGSLGGYEGLQEQMDYYSRIGDTEAANKLARYYAMEGLITNWAQMNVASGTPFGWWDGQVFGTQDFKSVEDMLKPDIGDYMKEYTTDTARTVMESVFGNAPQDSQMLYNLLMASRDDTSKDYFITGYDRLANKELWTAWDSVVKSLQETYDFASVLEGDDAAIAKSQWADQYAAYSLLYGKASQDSEKYRIGVTGILTETEDALSSSPALNGDTVMQNAEPVAREQLAKLPGIAETYGTLAAQDFNQAWRETLGLKTDLPLSDAENYTANGAADYTPGMSVAEAEAAAAETNESAKRYLDANPLSMDVGMPDGGAAGSAYATNAQAVLSANPGIYTVFVQQSGKLPTGGGGWMTAREYAEGGRATEPSIFGEVPGQAEWAIPEEHSERTLALLDAAREASGFTWPDLLNRNGGLNANPGRAPTQIIYSPTIYVNDAQGVAEKLAEDKERLNRWWRDKQLHDEVEVYQ